MTGVLGLSLAGCGGSAPPAPHPTLTVTAANASRVYGAANPTLTASASGALAGDTFTLTASTTATPSSPAGTYPIVPAATGTNLANYNVVYVNGTLTVSKATLTLAPNNQSIVEGSALPTFTATITGFVNGDTPAVVTGLPALTTTATSSSPPGSYPINAALGTLAAANYTFTFGTGALTITPANIPGSGFTGRAMAGTQPIVGATVQLYAAGTTGNGSTGTTLLSSTLTTDANRSLHRSRRLRLPRRDSQLYVIIRGGQVESAAPTPAITLSLPFGACNQTRLPAVRHQRSHHRRHGLGSVPVPHRRRQYRSHRHQHPGPRQRRRHRSQPCQPHHRYIPRTRPSPKTADSPAAKINSVANLLNTCTAATVRLQAAPRSSPPPLRAAHPPPTNTLDAALNLVHISRQQRRRALHPVDRQHRLSPPRSPHAPADWTLFINYAGGRHELSLRRRRRLHRQRLGRQLLQCRLGVLPSRQSHLP